MIFILKKKQGKKEPYILAETTVVTDRKKNGNQWKLYYNYINYSTIHTQFQNLTFQKLDSI